MADDTYLHWPFFDDGHRELLALVDELTTNETFFFRELRQLRALIQEILPERRLQDADRPVHIWSAGCASGEEPYTVVMMALEAGLVPGRDLRVYASDIAPTFVAPTRHSADAPRGPRSMAVTRSSSSRLTTLPAV